MQTIQLQVNDNLFDEAIKHVKQFIDTHKGAKLVNDDTQSYMQTQQYQKDKTYFQNSLNSIENGNDELVSHDDIWEQIDKHTQVH